MPIFFQPNRNLFEFWKTAINDLMVFKGIFDIDLLDGKTWEERLNKTIDLGFDKINELAQDICREIYANAVENISEFPLTYDKMLDELPNEHGVIVPFEVRTKYETVVKEDIIKNFEWVLKKEKNNEKVNGNLGIIIEKLLKVIGYKLSEKGDLPPGFNAQKKYKNLSPLLFRRLKKEVLKGQTIGQILHKEKRQNQLINQVLGTTTLPRDWVQKLAKQADLDALQNWKDNHVCSSDPCSAHADYSQLKDFKDNHTCPPTDNDLANKLVVAERLAQDRQEQLTQQQANYQTEKAQAVVDKEAEIITKIITDLSLSTERERERLRSRYHWNQN